MHASVLFEQASPSAWKRLILAPPRAGEVQVRDGRHCLTHGAEHDQCPRQLGPWVRHRLVLAARQHGFTGLSLSAIAA